VLLDLRSALTKTTLVFIFWEQILKKL
jgi:hypothetical protein